MKQQSKITVLVLTLFVITILIIYRSQNDVSPDITDITESLFDEFKTSVTSNVPETTKNPHKFLGDIEEDFNFETSKLKEIPKDIEEVYLEEPELPKLPEVNLSPLEFRIYSHNIKNAGSHTLTTGEQEWSKRVIPLVSSIKFHCKSNTIITLQEVYSNQLEDIMKLLGNEYDYYGHGRISQTIGELVPIIYKKSEWELVFKDTFWLNENDPRTNHQGWDAIYARIVSIVTLKHKTGNYVNIFNTHFDHIGQEAKLGSAKMIIEQINKFKWPSFLVGDLNTEPKEEPYKLLRNHLVDTAKLSTVLTRYGHSKSTVTGFEGEVLLVGQNIDYIFAPKVTKIEESCIQLDMFGLLHSKFNGVYFSDHRPLVGDFKFNEC